MYLAAPASIPARQDGPLVTAYKEAFTHEYTDVAAAAAEPEPKTGLLTVLREKLTSLLGQIDEQAAAVDDQVIPALTIEVPEVQEQVAGHLGIVLDLSGSMLSSGERLYHPVALALALTRLSQANVQQVTLAQVGGTDSLSLPALSPTETLF